MKKNLGTAVFMIVVSVLLLQNGCSKRDPNPVGAEVQPPAVSPVRTTTRVRFQVVIPETASKDHPNALILAQETTVPQVTFSIILVNAGNPGNPSTSLSKTVPAGASGTATAEFTGIPALTAIGEVKIAGGRIGSHSEFQGALDLVADSDNTIRVFPKGSQAPGEIVAEVIRRIIAQPLLFQDATPGLASRLETAFSGLSTGTTTVYDQAETAFTQIPVPPPAFNPGLRSWDLATGVSQFRADLIVRLPPRATILRSSLTALSNLDRFQVDNDGKTFINSTAGTGTPVLSLITSPSGNVVLMKIWVLNAPGQDNFVNASTTAEAMVLYDQHFLRLSPAEFANQRNLLAGRADFRALVGAIEASILANPNAPLTDDIFSRSFAIAQAMPATPNQSVRRGVFPDLGDPDPSKLFGIEDDPKRDSPDVILVNRSFCHYGVNITKNNLPFRPPAGTGNFRVKRVSPTSSAWSWPPGQGNESTVVGGIGPGELNFQFVKLSELSVFDGLMNIAGTVIGFKLDTMEELDEGLKLLAMSGNATMNLINTIITAPPPQSPSEGIAFIKDLLLTTGKDGLQILLEFAPQILGKKIQKELDQGWVSATTKIFLKKVILWGTLSYGIAETAAIMYSVARSPAGYEETGIQNNAGWYGDLFAKNMPTMKRVSLQICWRGRFSAIVYHHETNGNIVENTVPDYTPTTAWIFNYPFAAADGSWLGSTMTLPDGSIKINVASRTIETLTTSKEGAGVTLRDIPFFWFGDNYNGKVIDDNRMLFRLHEDSRLRNAITAFSYSGNSGPEALIGGETVKTWTFLEPLWDTDWKYSTYIYLVLSKG